MSDSAEKFSDELKYNAALQLLDDFFKANKHRVNRIDKDSDVWTFFDFTNQKLPQAGWKIHISSHIDELSRLLSQILPIIESKTLHFKICRSYQHYLLLNQGLLGDAQIGKVLTLYPLHRDETLVLYETLKPFCQDRRAAKVPSDIYFDVNDSLSFRYGAFANGKVVHDVYGQEKVFIPSNNGTWVEDIRSVYGDRSSTKEPEEKLFFQGRQATSLALTPTEKDGKIFRAHKDYRVIRRYGRPNKGVLLLEDIEKSRLIACKYAQKNTGYFNGLDYADNLKQEFSMLQELKGKIACPEALYIVEKDHFCYLFLSDIGGDSLDKLPNAIARLFFGQIVGLVQTLHDLGFVHRDLKLENFILDPSTKKLALIDFELSQKQNTPILYKGGTAGFYDQQYDQNMASVNDDYYALGAILAGLATNTNPTALHLDAHGLEQWLLLAGFPYLAKWIKKLMNRESKENCLHELSKAITSPDFFSAGEPKETAAIPKIDNTIIHSLKSFVRENEQGVFWSSPHPSLVYEHQGINIGSSGIIIGLHALNKCGVTQEGQDLLLKSARGLAFQEPYQLAQGLCTGNAGVALALAVAGQYEPSFKELAFERLSRASEPNGEFDFFFGAAGILYAGIIISDIYDDKTPLKMVNNLGEYLYESILDVEGVYSWPAMKREDQGQYPFLGIAHGALGSAMAMGLWAKKTQQHDARALAVEVFKRVFLYGRTKNGSFLKYDLHPDAHGRANNVWCHGAGGFLWGWVNLELCADEKDELSVSFDWAVDNYLLSSLSANSTYCHGLAGDLELALLLRENVCNLRDRVQPRIVKLAAALALKQKQQGQHQGLWPSDDPLLVCPDLLIGSMGPIAVLAQMASGKYSGILSARGLKAA